MKSGHLATIRSVSENDQLTAAIEEMIDSSPHVEDFHPWIGLCKGGQYGKGLKKIKSTVLLSTKF